MGDLNATRVLPACLFILRLGGKYARGINMKGKTAKGNNCGAYLYGTELPRTEGPWPFLYLNGWLHNIDPLLKLLFLEKVCVYCEPFKPFLVTFLQ